MANLAVGVNPSLLMWARERAGYSLEEVARSMGKDPQIVRLWESGGAVPTYNQLERLAYVLYKRPIAVFFFPEPPTEPEPKHSFRTLPDFEIQGLLPDTRHAIRQAQAIQLTLAELTEGTNPSPRKVFADITFSPDQALSSAAFQLRDYLGVTLEQQLSWRTTEQALVTWREAVQDTGIFVFKRAFKQDDISGFCLWEKEFPVIYLNNTTSKTRQIFSLFHEVAHILLHTSGVTKHDDRYIEDLTGEAKAIEVFCNRFTGEFLVPSQDFDNRLSRLVPIDTRVEDLAQQYKVSREVVLRKLLDRALVEPAYYNAKASQWHQEYIEWRKGRKPGGDYYATQAAYLGEKFLTLAFRKHYQGAYTIEQLADYLNVKVASVAGLEPFALRKGPAK